MMKLGRNITTAKWPHDDDDDDADDDSVVFLNTIATLLAAEAEDSRRPGINCCIDKEEFWSPRRFHFNTPIQSKGRRYPTLAV